MSKKEVEKKQSNISKHFAEDELKAKKEDKIEKQEKKDKMKEESDSDKQD